MRERSRLHTRKLTALGGIVALLAATVGFIFASAAPAFAGTNGNTAYELDCNSSNALLGTTGWVVGLNMNGSPDPVAPGGHFGGSGAAAVVLPGYFIAGAVAGGVQTVGGTISATLHNAVIGTTDGSATGTFTTDLSGSGTVTSHVVTTTYASGATTLTGGGFSASDVGDGVGGAGMHQGTYIASVDGSGNATLAVVAGAAAATTAGGTSVTLYPGVSLVDLTHLASIPATTFTATAPNGSHANIGLTGAASINVVTSSTIAETWGGTSGTGADTCLLTGYGTITGSPGPAQTPNSVPVLGAPALGGLTTPLVAATGGFLSTGVTPPAAAFSLVSTAPPTTSNGSANMGIGGTADLTLPQAGGTTCTVSAVSDPRLTVTESDSPTICAVHLVDSGSTTGSVTFQFTATNPGGTSSPASTITVSIGTAPVQEPLTQNVIGGALVLSCSAPGAVVYPLLTCPEFQFPNVTLDGVAHTVSGAGNTLYVSDNRGNPAVGWTLTASVVATPIGVGSNTNASCTGIVAFCNADVGTHALDASGNGQIDKGNLSIAAISCTPHAGNLNPAATPAPGSQSFTGTVGICGATAGSSGGTFDVNKTYSLVVPPSVYAGNYWGTVEYVVS